VEVLPLLGRAASLLMERSRRREVRVLLELPTGLPAVQADPEQLQQLFLNLLQNALDASPPGTAVRLSAGDDPLLPAEDRGSMRRGKVEGESLAVHFLDQGRGMTTEQLDRIFEPFFSTKADGKGTGLGMPIVEEIVRAHRGEVEMLSIPGRGTEAIVRLPLAAAAADAGQAEAAEASRHA
jgi:signal transduction histidine kinase